ncbi:uncharacterized protein [Antennarius striatus]|uniref:uncharacterized protein isoform X1 n=1 Tax=Antennarius striatus TaxID=241820 RepID=UPI0035AF98B4
MGRSPKAAFCSITTTDRKLLPSHSTLQDLMNPISPTKLQDAFGGRVSSIPTNTIRASDSKLGACRQNPTSVMPHEFRQAYVPPDELAVKNHERRKEQLGQCKLSCRECDRKQDMVCGSFTHLSPLPSYQSSIHREIPLWSVSTFVFLDKLLSLSLVELDSRRSDHPTLYRSTLFVHLSRPSYHRCSPDKQTKKNEGYRKPSVTMFVYYNNYGQENGLGHCGKPPLIPQGDEVELIRPICGINIKVSDSGTQHHRDTLGLISFRESRISIKKARRQKGNADEATSLSQSNSRHLEPTSNSGPDSRTWTKRTGTQQERDTGNISTSEKSFAGMENYFLEGTSGVLSLKEALELFRPGFISRSQGRVRSLEQRAIKRRALRNSNPDLVQGLRDNPWKKRNCTTPDPLSDNLFKPRERSISGKEMQLRSRRIYNKLPEVTKKKEEEKKKAVLQTNRLRAEVFKKKLLDQILQRQMD